MTLCQTAKRLIRLTRLITNSLHRTANDIDAAIGHK